MKGVNRGGLVGFEGSGSFESDPFGLRLKFTPVPDPIKFLGWLFSGPSRRGYASFIYSYYSSVKIWRNVATTIVGLE